MQIDLSWGFMRLAMWLSEVLPCAYTQRLRCSHVSRCMRHLWY